MAKTDISRSLFQPNKHYSTAHMQQGRVLTDADFNERSMIEAEDLRASLVDIICAHGTPNDGMLVSGVGDTPYEFTLGAGSYYLGGLRFAVDALIPPESFLTQRDWLQVDGVGDGLPTEPVDGRTDLVYVHGWEQPVTAIEDSELQEVALGDRDTSVRIKRMRHFAVMTDVQEDNCADAFAALIATYAGASFDAENCELLSGGLLQVAFVGSGEEENLCADPTTTGYVGAENQAIRVELRPDNKLVWGFDNASKIYRVSVTAPNQITFITEPADLPSMPRVGQVVEILPWGALLPNMEKVAEPQGMITSVATTYDPETKLLVITDPVDASWTTWLSEHTGYRNTNDPVGEQDYMYLRVWDRGAEIAGAPQAAEIDLGAGPTADILLGTTGLEITVNLLGIPGDYWIIAARPSTPNVVTPWDMAAGSVPPHGPRRFYAPLAMIDWTVNGETSSVVGDCRTKLRRLCEGGCCTVTLGDGKHSFGMVNTFEDALDLLADGGTLCVLPGVHEGGGLLEGAKDIIIEGCGPKSVLESPPTPGGDPETNAELFYDPVLTLLDCERIQIKNLRIEAHSAVGVMIEKSEPLTCEDILLEDVEVFSTGFVSDSVREFGAPCVAVRGASDVVIRRCNLEMDAVTSISAAVVLSGYRLRLLDSRVAAPVYDGVELGAMGGVQIRSATHEVDIIGCEIVGGWGNGVSLGQVEHFDRNDAMTLDAWDVHNYPVGAGIDWLTDEGLGTQYMSNGAAIASTNLHVWLPVGPVERVRIHDNVIHQVGLSGVASMEFFQSEYNWSGIEDGAVFLVAIDVDICRNTIEDNVKLSAELPPFLAQQNDHCVGGVCLGGSINATIRENQILRNGTGSPLTPICGIGLIAAQNVLIEDNRITDNGPQFNPAVGPVTVGLRGGIAIAEATKLLGYTMSVAPQVGLVMPLPVTTLGPSPTGAAVIVRGNEVSQPLGRALWVQRGFGAITVTGNSFDAFGNPVLGDAITDVTLRWQSGVGQFDRPASGACVEIIDYGLALDVDWTSFTPPAPIWADESGDVVDGGNVLLSGNAMSLDWGVEGGHACSVLVSSLGSAVYDSNSSSVAMHNPYGTAELPQDNGEFPMEELLADVSGLSGTMSLVLANVYIGAKSTAQASGNRSTEGEFDALFSLVVGPALAPIGENIADLEHAASVIANVGTHCWVAGFATTTTNDLKDYNISVYPAEHVDDCGQTYSLLASEFGPGRIISIV